MMRKYTWPLQTAAFTIREARHCPAKLRRGGLQIG